ncbi:TolC family outer membrane protein [Sphingomonas sp.]|uniref:TolC family outer membrane protein n=1 Tax=Sphingomonas sp. TaxID=28214 RepID=UPI003AFF818F
MRRIVVSLLLAGTVTATPAAADTLREALLRAYQSNPTITGARAQQRAIDENVPIARADGLPSIQTNGGYSENLLTSGNSFASPARQAQASANLVVPLYRGGAVRNSVRAAETRVEAGQAGLRDTEAVLFTNVVAAYEDVIRDEAIVGLNQQNVRVLEVNLRASRDRFQVGDLTRTDVAQSEARLSIARAQLQSAEARLIGSRENYVRLIGTPPGTLDEPPPLPNLPVVVDNAVQQALAQNPALIAAARQRDATRYDIAVARAQRLPQISGTAGGSYSDFLGSLGAGTTTRVGQTGTAGTLGLSVNLPLFQGGRPAALVRQAEARRSQAIEAVTETERGVIAQARSSFAVYRSSQEVILSSEQAVNANKLSLEGVRAENSVGTRTILDILNAEQELLNSQVTLVTARRDAYVAGFNLLAAMGRAEARDLGLEGGPLYDPTVNYNRVRHRISDFGGDGEPAPVATTTGQTPAQTATVTKPLDPLLDAPVDRNRPLTTGSASPNRQ